MFSTYDGPAAYALADWRRRINDLYAEVRATRDPVDGWRHWRDERSRLYAAHPMSPVPDKDRPAFDGIEMYSYDPGFRFEVHLEALSGEPVRFDLAGDGVMVARPVSLTRGLDNALGGELTVYWIEGYGGGLFIPFKDATTGGQTYGGGRYIVDAIKGSDLGLGKSGRLILDFNFAYTPSCAWTPDFVCPLSPPENTLPASVTAGEKTP
ncbi:DUF1684 domain-containing protein [uncultured Litoreibacter sp.]|uniref:DUF1684 domain-containing protein n=1 Tax=uncultured Litoreibacter sp. TaxID=1392394 RepID=UPI00260D8BF6|nr:DUF1684 domain-containing protein [uncultured Litoreibacter sp.]